MHSCKEESGIVPYTVALCRSVSRCTLHWSLLPNQWESYGELFSGVVHDWTCGWSTLIFQEIIHTSGSSYSSISSAALALHWKWAFSLFRREKCDRFETFFFFFTDRILKRHLRLKQGQVWDWSTIPPQTSALQEGLNRIPISSSSFAKWVLMLQCKINLSSNIVLLLYFLKYSVQRPPL